jgi:hypothetical protein
MDGGVDESEVAAGVLVGYSPDSGTCFLTASGNQRRR